MAGPFPETIMRSPKPWQALLRKYRPDVCFGPEMASRGVRTMSDRKFAWLLVTPIVLVAAVLAIGPLVYAVVVSVVKLDLTRGGMAGFVGLDNYRYVLFQPAFWNAIGTTLELTVKAVGLQMALGILIAWLLTRTSHYRSIFTALLILPLATAPAVTGLFWRYLYDTEFGVINALCSILRRLNWLGSVDLALKQWITASAWTPPALTVRRMQILSRRL